MQLFDLLILYRALFFAPPVEQATLLARFSLLRRIARHILPEYRFKWPQMDWWHDREFDHYLEKFDELDGANTDRRFAVSQLLRLTHAIDGDTAEVGAYRGAMSYLILKSASDRERTHHIFDSFEGLSRPLSIDGTHWSPGALACCEEELHRNLSEFAGRFTTYKGWVPTRFDEVSRIHFAFVHIDVDLYEPTRDSIAFFYERMNDGGLIVCDDYGFTSCPGATKACDEFLSDKPEKMIGLSAGGGFFIKGLSVARTDHDIQR